MTSIHTHVHAHTHVQAHTQHNETYCSAGDQTVTFRGPIHTSHSLAMLEEGRGEEEQGEEEQGEEEQEEEEQKEEVEEEEEEWKRRGKGRPKNQIQLNRAAENPLTSFSTCSTSHLLPFLAYT